MRFQITTPLRPLARTPAAQANALAFSLVAATAAHAARPMITDDARIVDARTCQVETWVKQDRDSTEYWALPACNFTGNLELTLGGALGKDDTGTHTTDVIFQGKTLFKTLEANGWSWGLVFGNVGHPAIQSNANLVGDLYAYLPASFSFRDDRLVLHTNLAGYTRNSPAGTASPGASGWRPNSPAAPG